MFQCRALFVYQEMDRTERPKNRSHEYGRKSRNRNRGGPIVQSSLRSVEVPYYSELCPKSNPLQSKSAHCVPGNLRDRWTQSPVAGLYFITQSRYPRCRRDLALPRSHPVCRRRSPLLLHSELAPKSNPLQSKSASIAA